MTESEFKTLRAAEKEIATYEMYVAQVEEFKETVTTAVEAFQAKKYAPLYKAYKEYGERWADIEEAYGWGAISRSKYDKLGTLKSKMESDQTAVLMEDVLQSIDRRIESLKSYIVRKEELKAYILSKEKTE